MTAPSCLAIVVSYNSAATLPACLASLERQRGVQLRVVVIDNASSDESAGVVPRLLPRAHVIQNKENRGFGRAVNQALELEPEAPFYALVNPDTELHSDAIASSIAYLDRDARAAIVGTRLTYPDGSAHPSCHAFLGLRNLLGETFGIHRLAPGLRPLSSFHMPWFHHDRIAEVDWIQGAFLVLRGPAVRQAGGFDPEFFMYGEEMDLCLRLRHSGWSVVFLPEPAVVHEGGASSAPVAGPMFVENLKSRIRFFRKHRGPLATAATRGLIAVSVLLRLLWSEIRALPVSASAPEDSVRRRRAMFRAAARWVLRGLPA